MKILNSLTRPYYLYRPSQILRRLRWEWAKSDTTCCKVTLPWGHQLRVSPRDDIGQTLGTTGISDLVVTEAIFRILRHGDLAVDVGANIGYMTSAMAAVVGSAGSVMSFEPHPDLYKELCTNVSIWLSNGQIEAGCVETRQQAASNEQAIVVLSEPAQFDGNRGRSQIKSKRSDRGALLHQEDGKRHEVEAVTLDTALADKGQIDLMKVDVEGYEFEVLEGASNLLKEGRVRNIIFEEFNTYPAATHRTLLEFGYSVFVIEERVLGPRLRRAFSGWQRPRYSPPNFIATQDPDKLASQFSALGWLCLRSE